MKSILILLSTLLLVSSCGTSNTSSKEDKETSVANYTNGHYQINTLSNKNVLSNKRAITFNEKTKRIYGSYGCNTFSGSYELKDDTLKIVDLLVTEIDCSDKVSDFDVEYLEALRRANRLITKGNSVTLFKGNQVLLTAVKEVTKNLQTIEYSSISRGSSKLIKANSSGITIITASNSKTINKKYNKGGWDKLIQLVNAIDLDKLSSLEPPSKNYQFDGAALAHFKVILKNKVYEVQPFDHGKPHPVIEPLVKEILSIVENIE